MLACQIPELLRSVRSNLDACTLPNPTVEDLIEAKFYYAGGSARLMFRFNTEKVKEFIHDAVREVSHVEDYIAQCISDTNKSAVNRLSNSYKDISGIRRGCLLSKYAALGLTSKGGPCAVMSIRDALGALNNKALDGWVFELLFFSRLEVEGLKLKPKSGIVCKYHTAHWPFISTVPVDVNLFTGQADVWIKPARWNQAGFDALLISPGSRTVEFFKVTRSLNHRIALSHFSSCLRHLDSSLNFTVVVNVVVPLAHLELFKPGPFTGVQTMRRFDWKKADLAILGMEDIQN